MTPHDLINAIFEGGGALFLCLNIRRLLKDRSVKGVSLVTTSWWTAWGFWNVYFYAAVSCSASFWAGLAVVVANAVWLGLAVYYARQAPTWADIEVKIGVPVFKAQSIEYAEAQPPRPKRLPHPPHYPCDCGCGTCRVCGAEL